MSKMVLHDSFGHLKHMLWPKEGRESNWQFDSKPLKVGILLDFLMCKWRATCHWKDLGKCYNFFLDLTSIRSLRTKLWSSKMAGVLTLGILGFQLGSPRTKWHLGVGPITRHKEYYKGGKVVPSPKFGPWWVLWICICLWLVRASKVL
jgi:hypothetical protein